MKTPTLLIFGPSPAPTPGGKTPKREGNRILLDPARAARWKHGLDGCPIDRIRFRWAYSATTAKRFIFLGITDTAKICDTDGRTLSTLYLDAWAQEGDQ